MLYLLNRDSDYRISFSMALPGQVKRPPFSPLREGYMVRKICDKWY